MHGGLQNVTEIGRTPVMAWGPCQVGVHKKCKVMSKATIEEEGDDMAWVPLPAPKVVGMTELPFEKALVGIMKEMKASWKSWSLREDCVGCT